MSTASSTAAGPSKRPPPGRSAPMTPAEQQAAALAKLLKNPDKPIVIPDRPREGASKTLRAPREMMKNVQGSSAGAGSGEFHVYKQARRREYERLKIMDEEEAYFKEKAEAEKRQAEYNATAEAKTAKNRLKRQRKKAGRANKKGGAHEDGQSSDDGAATKSASGANGGEVGEGGGSDKKRKLGGGGNALAMRFKTADERDAEEEAEETREQREQRIDAEIAAAAAAAHEQQVAAAKEAGITIQDDD